MESLPKDAQIKGGDLGTRKSYTQPPPEGKTSSIGVILNKHSWYISPVDSIPEGPKFEDMKINIQKGVSLAFGCDVHESWITAKQIANW